MANKNEMVPFFSRPTSLLEEFFNEFKDFASPVKFEPKVDVYETKDSLVFEVEAQGIKKDDINITVKDGILSISGKKEDKRKEEGRDYRLVERSYGEFKRSFYLPDYVEVEKIKAEHKDGILTITIPRKEEAKPKEINVKIEG
jgi:HSP20 family protein